MKFREYLEKNKNSLYNQEYLDYLALTNLIKHKFSQEEEIQFIEKFNKEFKKVFNFINSQKERAKSFNSERLNSLSQFMRVNIIGFKKILKRHDKKSGFSLFKTYKSEFKHYIMQLKQIDALIRNTTSTFLVKEKDFLNIKYLIEKRVISGASIVEEDVNCVYFDNTGFEMYQKKIQNCSNLIRIRWTGEVTYIEKTNEIFFKINKNQILDFINGKNITKELKELNKSESSLVFEEIQAEIISKRLRPVLRTFSKRITYTFNSKVLIKVDSEIFMIRECSKTDMESACFPIKAWCRPNCEYPFQNISCLIKFPFYQITVEGRLDKWLEDILINAKRLELFSKYVHGCSVLYNTTVEPYWIGIFKNDEEDKNDQDAIIEIPSDFTVGQIKTPEIENKTVVIPVKIEPKVFFANERTFLSWIQFAIFLGGIGTAMLGLGNYHAAVCGLMLIIVSAAFAIYSLYLFQWRAQRIRSKDPGPYDDLYGPIVLVTMFMFVMVCALIFKFPIKKSH